MPQNQLVSINYYPMKKIILVFCSLFFTAFSLISQEKVALIDLNKQHDITDNSYHQLFKLSKGYTQKQIEEFKVQSLAYKHVEGITINKVFDGYDVKLSLNKEADDTPYYFRDYLLTMSVDYVVIDGNKVKTTDYYTYLSKKLMHKEYSKN